MKESLETKSKQSIFKKFDNFLFKLMAYIIDRVPFYDKITKGHYSRIDSGFKRNYIESGWKFKIPSQYEDNSKTL